MAKFDVLVRYRTNSGCNAAIHTVEAEKPVDAIWKACDARRKRRGVIRIDGGEVCVWAEPEEGSISYKLA